MSSPCHLVHELLVYGVAVELFNNEFSTGKCSQCSDETYQESCLFCSFFGKQHGVSVLEKLVTMSLTLSSQPQGDSFLKEVLKHWLRVLSKYPCSLKSSSVFFQPTVLNHIKTLFEQKTSSLFTLVERLYKTCVVEERWNLNRSFKVFAETETLLNACITFVQENTFPPSLCEYWVHIHPVEGMKAEYQQALDFVRTQNIQLGGLDISIRTSKSELPAKGFYEDLIASMPPLFDQLTLDSQLPIVESINLSKFSFIKSLKIDNMSLLNLDLPPYLHYLSIAVSQYENLPTLPLTLESLELYIQRGSKENTIIDFRSLEKLKKLSLSFDVEHQEEQVSQILVPLSLKEYSSSNVLSFPNFDEFEKMESISFTFVPKCKYKDGWGPFSEKSFPKELSQLTLDISDPFPSPRLPNGVQVDIPLFLQKVFHNYQENQSLTFLEFRSSDLVIPSECFPTSLTSLTLQLDICPCPDPDHLDIVNWNVYLSHLALLKFLNLDLQFLRQQIHFHKDCRLEELILQGNLYHPQDLSTLRHLRTLNIGSFAQNDLFNVNHLPTKSLENLDLSFSSSNLIDAPTCFTQCERLKTLSIFSVERPKNKPTPCFQLPACLRSFSLHSGRQCTIVNRTEDGGFTFSQD